jgi:hypothetical protein
VSSLLCKLCFPHIYEEKYQCARSIFIYFGLITTINSFRDRYGNDSTQLTNIPTFRRTDPLYERHCEMDVWPPHPIPATLFRVLRLHWGGALQCTGGFLSAGLPYSSFSISDFSRISRFPRKRYPRMPRCSDSAGSFHDSHYRHGRCCLPHSGTESAPKKL